MICPKTNKRIPGVLRNIKIMEVSGCDSPANPFARVVMLKGPSALASVAELPEVIRKLLPVEAQKLFMAEANKALEEHDESEAFKTAWAVVRQHYERRDGEWVAKSDLSFLKSLESVLRAAEPGPPPSVRKDEHMTAFAKAESDMAAIVKRHMEVHGVPEHVAHDRLSCRSSEYADADAYRAAYSAMANANDIAVAKSSTLLTYEKRTSVAKSSPAFANDAERQLDALAEQHATAQRVSKAMAYDAVLSTDEGRRLYRESYGK